MMNNYPRYVRYRGKLARVLNYRDHMFEILMPGDERHFVHRDRLTFTRSR